MPFVNVKVVKNQINEEIKNNIIKGLTDLIVNVMSRDQSLTTIVIDEIEPSSWAINGAAINTDKDFVSFVNIKVSKGTTNPEEMSAMINKIKDLMSRLIGNQATANYVIIDELNELLLQASKRLRGHIADYFLIKNPVKGGYFNLGYGAHLASACVKYSS